VSTIHGYPLDHGLDYGLRVPWIGLDLDWPFLNGYPSIGNTVHNGLVFEPLVKYCVQFPYLETITLTYSAKCPRDAQYFSFDNRVRQHYFLHPIYSIRVFEIQYRNPKFMPEVKMLISTKAPLVSESDPCYKLLRNGTGSETHWKRPNHLSVLPPKRHSARGWFKPACFCNV
jgi:hypothetical protein